MQLEILALAAVISIAAYISELFGKKIERYHGTLISLNAGILISVAILELLPISLKTELGHYLMLAGFVAFYLLEDYIYHSFKKSQIKKDISMLHFVGFFLVSFLFGIAFYTSSIISLSLSMVLFVPLAIRKILVSLFATHLTERLRLPLSKELLAFSTFFGALFAVAMPEHLLKTIFSFITGSLLFLVARDLVHPERRGSLLPFVIGIMTTLASYILL
jgi:hypothetical protein